jgi:hypothetical protein
MGAVMKAYESTEDGGREQEEENIWTKEEWSDGRVEKAA